MMRGLIVAGPLALIMLLLSGGGALAVSNPYPAGTSGWDASSPNCSWSGAPPGSFGIVGVTGGRPFTVNTCSGKEYQWAAALGAPSLYFNTAYSGAYKRNLLSTGYCATAPSGLIAKYQQAWSIGCSEAAFAYGKQPGSAATWWLDVETSNSWSSSDLQLNRSTIQGSVDYLSFGANVAVANIGIYSYSGGWSTITGGGWQPNGIAAAWTSSGGCASFLPNAPVWLAQSPGTFSGGSYDLDQVCP